MVEDELIIAMEMESLLRQLGYVVIAVAPTVTQALQALGRERPDLAVLDVNLRGERVTPVAEALTRQGVPFVLVTGYGRERLHHEALRDARSLRKPVDGQRLARVLAEILTRDRSS